MPFVGDIGRSDLSGEMRPCEGDIAKPRASGMESVVGGSKRCALEDGIGDPIFADEFPITSEPLEPALKAMLDEDRSRGSSNGFSGRDASRDIPGICTLPECKP